MIYGAAINVLDYGADPTGTNDSLAAFDLAILAGNDIVIPEGTYKITATWLIPAGKNVCGSGYETTGYSGRPSIVPTVAVTGAAIDFLGKTLKNIFVDGTNTTGVVGLRMGNAVIANLNIVQNVEVANFKGTGANGLQILNCVGAYFTNCRFNKNNQGVDIGSLATTSGCPTTLVFNECWFRESVGTGVVLRRGNQISFYDCLWESNFGSGMYADGNAGQVLVGVHVHGGWCEDNWRGLSVPARTAQAHFEFIGVGGSFENFTVQDTLFSGSATGERAIIANDIHDLNIIAPITSTSGGANIIQTIDSFGWLNFWRHSGSTGWYNSGGAVNTTDTIFGRWISWTPTFTPLGSMTYTAITIATAQYKIIGKTLMFELNVIGTTGGSASARIDFDLPLGITSANSNYLICRINDNGTPVVGTARTQGINAILLNKLDGSNFTLGTTGFTGSFTLEID